MLNLFNRVKNDVAFGISEEERMTLILQLFFKDTLKKTEQFSSMDWIGESGTKYELKSRKINKSQYETTIIPASKLDNLDKGVFIFKFLDGVFYIQYDKELFKNFVVADVYSDGRFGNPYRPHVHIPVNLLQPLN